MQIDSLIEKKLVFVSGKGGVGKTFTAAWLAKYAISKKKKVLLVESGTISQLGTYFNHSVSLNVLSHHNDKLSLLHIDFEGCLKDYLQLQLKKQSLQSAFLTNKKMRSFLDAIPGLPEIMMLGRLYYSAAREEIYDLVIYDSPASGHFLNLMTTLGAIVNTGLTGPLIHQVNTIIAYLSVKELCGAVLVTSPEELVINETFDFLPRLLEHSPVTIDGLIINHCFENFIEERWEKELGPGLYKYISAKVTSRHTYQQQIQEGVKDYFVSVLGRFRELGNVSPETFFEQALITSNEQVSDASPS